MRTAPVAIPALPPDKLASLKAVLKMKGTQPQPTYAEIAADFGITHKSVKKVHNRMFAEADERNSAKTTNPEGYERSEILDEMQNAVAEGRPLHKVFAPIDRDEMMAMMAGITRLMFRDLGLPSNRAIGSPAMLLKYFKEYGLMRGFYTQRVEPTGDVVSIADADLTAIAQATREHLDALEAIKVRRGERKFLDKYATKVIEIEAEDIGVLGEAQGG